MAKLNLIAVRLMEHLCEHDWHGYTMSNPGRNGDGEGVCPVIVDGRTYNLQQGDRDCSSSTCECWKMALAGTPFEGKLNAAQSTHNMRKVFTGSGLFEWKPMSFVAQPGDLYIKEGSHVAMCVSAVPDMLAEFSLNEKGGAYGGKVGDQTGRESRIGKFYDYPWDGILHYVGGDVGSASGKPAAAPMPRYRVRTSEDGWLPWMQGFTSSDGSGEDFAGERGHAIVDFEWEAPAGSWFTLTLANGLELAKNQHAKEPLSGITLYYVTPQPGVTGFKKAKYRVAPIDKDFLKWEFDDEDDGAGGAGVIDRLQLTLE